MSPLDAVVTSDALVQGIQAVCSCGIRTRAELEAVSERLVSMAVPPPERFMYTGGGGSDDAEGSSGRVGRRNFSADDAMALHAKRKRVWVFRPAAASGADRIAGGGARGGGRRPPQRMNPELRVALSAARPTSSVDVEFVAIARGSTVPKDMYVPSNISFRQFSYGSIMLPSAVTLDADFDERIPTSITALLRVFESMGYVLERETTRDTFVVDLQRDSNARLAVNLISTPTPTDEENDGANSAVATLEITCTGQKTLGFRNMVNTISMALDKIYPEQVVS